MPEVRLIDANAFTEQYGNYYAEEGPAEGFIGTVGDLIAKQPTIEAEPMRRGYWMYTDETIWDAKEIDGKQREELAIVAGCCSVCKRWAEQVNKISPRMVYERCPNCGALMDGGGDHGEKK